MARISKETIELREKLLNKHKDIFKLLHAAGGALYNIHIEQLLNLHKNTLRYKLNKLSQAGLVACDTVNYNSTSRTVTRLTKPAWRLLGVDRDLGSIQEERLNQCLLNACIYNFFIKTDKNDKDKTVEFFDIINDFSNAINYKQIVSNNDKLIDLSLFKERYDRNIAIIDFDISDDVKTKSVDVIFHKNNPQVSEVATFCDHLLGVIEKAFFFKNKNFYYEPFKLKINLYVVSTIKISKIDLDKELNNKIREYSYFNHKSKSSMYTARQVHFRKLKFYCLDSYNLSFNKY